MKVRLVTRDGWTKTVDVKELMPELRMPFTFSDLSLHLDPPKRDPWASAIFVTKRFRLRKVRESVNGVVNGATYEEI